LEYLSRGVDRREDQFRIIFLLADGWADHHASIANFKNCSRKVPLLVPHLNTMQSPNWSLFHRIANRMFAISGPPVDAGAHQEMGA
jgi:hypothetical protein